MAVTRPEGWLHRGPRPFLMWLAVLLVVLVLAFFVAIGLAIVQVFQHAADTFQPVPDMSGGLGVVLTGVAAVLPALAAFIPIFMRHRERMDQQSRGSAPPPFAQPPPSSPPQPPGDVPGGGLVNPQALE